MVHRPATELAEVGRRGAVCGARFHTENNFPCRHHKGLWDGRRWPCCDVRDEAEPGCHVESEGHVAREESKEEIAATAAADVS